MSWFTPYKKRPDAFVYTPRFYDPRKEELERRRKERHGQSAETDEADYVPGMYLRTQREARAMRKRENGGRLNRNSGIVIAAAVALLVLFVYMVYPRLTELFATAASRHGVPKATTEQFDPYAPIVIVPNDYNEE